MWDVSSSLLQRLRDKGKTSPTSVFRSTVPRRSKLSGVMGSFVHSPDLRSAADDDVPPPSQPRTPSSSLDSPALAPPLGCRTTASVPVKVAMLLLGCSLRGRRYSRHSYWHDFRLNAHERVIECMFRAM